MMYGDSYKRQILHFGEGIERDDPKIGVTAHDTSITEKHR